MRTPTRSHRRPIVGVNVHDDNISVASPFSLKKLARSVPGGKWDKTSSVWRYPRTPQAAANIVETYRDAECELRFGAELDTLLDEQRAKIAEGNRLKNADELEPIAVTAFPAWRHQLQAFHFARDLPAAMLAMDMGTGKSKVTIDLLTNNDARRVLILAPPSVVDVWPREFRKHAGVEWTTVPLRKGSVKKRTEMARENFESPLERVAVVINYEACHRDPFKSWAKDVEWDYLVLDESHKIKSPTGVTSRYVHVLSKTVPRRLALTGTPLPQTPLDVFGQYRALDSDIFGTNYTSFKNRYAEWGGYGGYQLVRLRNEPDFNRRFYSIAYRVEAEDVLDLPPEMDVTRECSLEGAQAKSYGEVDADFHTWVTDRVGDDQEVTIANALVRLLRLSQLTGGAIKDDEGNLHVVGKAKAKLLTEVLDEIDDAEPVVVFCRFRHDLDVVRETAAELGRPYGEVSGRANDLVEAELPDVAGLLFGVQMQSGGVGIDLTRARYGIYYSVGYSLSDYLQSRRRIHRPGQAHPTIFAHLIAEGTIDEEVYAAIEAREEVVDYILKGLGVKR